VSPTLLPDDPAATPGTLETFNGSLAPLGQKPPAVSKKNKPGPLSHSSAQTLMTCEQRWVYYKVDGFPNDPDYEKADSLGLGSAFHKVLEDSKHEKPASIRAELEKCVLDPDVQLRKDDILLVHAMILKYLRLHKQMGFKVLAVETEVKTDSCILYVDAVMEDLQGFWWIVDLKTYKQLPNVAMLSRDPQLTLYASHAALIAEIYQLDLKKFGGVRWRVVTKSAAKMQPKEDEATFVKRLVEKHVKAYDIPVPKETLDTEERLAIHTALYKRSLKLAQSAPIRNYASCFNYYSPCQYWSRCYGKTYSEMQDFTHVTVLE
jgi:hypothetical protein